MAVMSAVFVWGVCLYSYVAMLSVHVLFVLRTVLVQGERKVQFQSFGTPESGVLNALDTDAVNLLQSRTTGKTPTAQRVDTAVNIHAFQLGATGECIITYCFISLLI